MLVADNLFFTCPSTQQVRLASYFRWNPDSCVVLIIHLVDSSSVDIMSKQTTGPQPEEAELARRCHLKFKAPKKREEPRRCRRRFRPFAFWWFD